MEEITKDLLAAFSERAKANTGSVPYSVSFDFGTSDQSIFVCSAIHGDEVGSIPAILRIIDDLKSSKIKFNGKITFALGNVEAIKINKRFVTEDMNRIFGKPDPQTVDAKRATEIASLITSHTVFIDLHQTIGPTKSPFYVIRGSDENIQLAKITAAAPLAILVDDYELKNTKHVTSTAFAAKHKVHAFTLELSQKGYNVKSESIAYNAILKVIDTVNHYPVVEWPKLASISSNLKLVRIEHICEFSDPSMRLVPGLINGEFYKKDFVLGTFNGKNIVAPFDGYIFFPKYPERDENQNALRPLPSHLFEFGKVVN